MKLNANESHKTAILSSNTLQAYNPTHLLRFGFTQ